MISSWRDEIQQLIDMNNSMRSVSDIRIGDSLTSYKPSEEGAGRAYIRDNNQRIEDAIDGQSLKAALFADYQRNYGSV